MTNHEAITAVKLLQHALGSPRNDDGSLWINGGMSTLEEICEKTGAINVHHIGKQLVIYRKSETPKIVIPK